MIKFNKHNVTETETKAKARVWYSLDNRVDGRACVTIYHKDYSDALYDVMGGEGYVNDTDSMTDYFEKGRVTLFADHPLYTAARKRAEANKAADDARYAKRLAA